MPLTYIAEPILSIDGQAAPQNLIENIQQIIVEESLHLPSTFTLVIYNPYQGGSEEDEFFQFADSFKIGNSVKIGFTSSTTESQEFETQEKGDLIEGEITAIETYFNADSQAPIVIRGYDVSHRLHRGQYNRSFQNMTDTDIVNKIIGEVGISSGSVENTSGPYGYGDINGSNGYTLQYNQTNMDFLRKLAHRNGFECFVQDGKFNFRKPSVKETLELTWLQTLNSFSVRVSSAHQVSSVEARGWDYSKKAGISETISNDKGVLTQNEYGKGKKTSQSFKGQPPTPKMVVVDRPVANTSQAKAIAQTLFDELSGEFVQADARANGNPKLRPGRAIKLKGIGPHSGEYYITETRHIYQNRVYTTEFSVRGLRGGGIFSLLNTSSQDHHSPAGLMVGIVTDNKDPKGWGRVRVKLPAVSDEHTSYWARVVSIGAGSNRGLDCLPEIDDEVLIGFENGDPDRPYVIGNVWNGKDSPPAAIADTVVDGKVRLRTFKTRTGHTLQFVEEDKGSSNKGIYVDTVYGHHLYCNDTEQFIEAKTKNGHQVRCDDKGKKILVKTQNGHEISLNDQGQSITLKSTGKITIEAPQNIEIKVGTSTIQLSTTSINIKQGGNKIELGPSGITVDSPTMTNVSGTTTSVKGKTAITVSAPTVSLG
jgi:uncharacterized protein involved in type VI secretion and phage assembly